MKSFSIITPVYNGQEYIANCINTIAKLNYDLNKIEHIVVDDGSTDDTKKICEQLAKKYSHVKFYSKKNGNWGSVINYVKHKKLVHNDYVIVCDGDDFILPNALRFVNKKNNGADIFCGSYKIQYSKGPMFKIFPYMFFFKRELVRKNNEYYISRYMVPNCVYFKSDVFYKIDDLTENVMYQDGVLFIELYKHSKKIRFTPKALSIYWRGRTGNTMSQAFSSKGMRSWQSRIQYSLSNDLVEEFSLQLIFNKPHRIIAKNSKNKFIFHHKPKFCAYPWVIRFFVWILYRIVSKKYIKITIE